MCEVTTNNFESQFGNIRHELERAAFISIDSEFSALTVSKESEYSLFDTPSDRYNKLRTTIRQIVPVQIGLTAFSLNPDTNTYTGKVFKFYIFPRAFSSIDERFAVTPSSFQFLCTHKFDFNKFIYEGIPYLSRNQEMQVRRLMAEDRYSMVDSSMYHELESLVEQEKYRLNKWMKEAALGDICVLKDVENFHNNLDVRYYLHKELREHFKRTLWTYEENGEFVVKKVEASQWKELELKYNLNEVTVSNLLGFTKMFRLITSLGKPLVGHNILMDLMLIIDKFETFLPHSYSSFKKLAHDLFPIIYDTKTLSFNFKQLMPDAQLWSHNTLESLYKYFKDGSGRHLVRHSPLIEAVSDESAQYRFHDAGWDSYCTGYIFVRMAHVAAAKQSRFKGHTFLSRELFAATEGHSNSVNLIRATVSHIQLDGDDPPSKRPPYLIIESVKNRPVNISQVTSILSRFGFVEVKPHSLRGRRAIVAVDNFSSARQILQQFHKHSSYRIQRYSTLKHSPVVQTIFWSGSLATAAFLLWYSYNRLPAARMD